MANATDIITYIGIPLAVLGVLPILYTFALSILTQRRIRHRLIAYGHRPQRNVRGSRGEGFVLRASPMTSLIEVEMPRYTIAPVGRGDEKYWVITQEARGNSADDAAAATAPDSRLLRAATRELEHWPGHEHAVNRAESTLSMLEEGRVHGFLRGGSWRTFHWRRLVVGRKLYRIQYEDELREPPAEIDFADLVNFLLDWGAELDGMGWEKLRSGGLWTPSGTMLLKAGKEHDAGDDDTGTKPGTPANEWVLRTSMPDDSDGILTLCVRWPPAKSFGSARDATSLPPGWGRLRRPKDIDLDDRRLEKQENEQDSLANTSASCSETESLSAVITRLTQQAGPSFHRSTSVRFTLSSDIISSVHPEIHNREIDNTLTVSLSSLAQFSLGTQWFTSATTALLTLNQGASTGTLWGFSPDPEILAFARQDTVPCGVLVLLQLLDADSAPQWEESLSSDDTQFNNPGLLHLRRVQARAAAQSLEATMPPDQALVHRRNREAEEMRQRVDAVAARLQAERLKEHKRMQDALKSPRMGCIQVARTCRAWLVRAGYVPAELTLEGLAEATLWMIVVQSQVRRPNRFHSKDSEQQQLGGAPIGNDQVAQGDNAAEEVDNINDDNSDTAPVQDNTFGSVLDILEAWMSWSLAGGMTRDQYDLVDRHKRDFCLAACLVAVIHRAAMSASSQGMAKASVDMLECLKLWRKVRLG